MRIGVVYISMISGLWTLLCQCMYARTPENILKRRKKQEVLFYCIQCKNSEVIRFLLSHACYASVLTNYFKKSGI